MAEKYNSVLRVCPADHQKQRVLEKRLYAVDGSSSFLECIPKSLQAQITWTYQKHPENPREEVRERRERQAEVDMWVIMRKTDADSIDKR